MSPYAPMRVNVLDAFIVGSTAKGNGTEESDLDIAVVIPPVRGKSALAVSEAYHQKFFTDDQKPRWIGKRVDFQFFYPSDPELESYAKIPLDEAKEIDLSKYRDCSAMGLSGSIAASFGVIRRGGKSWCPAAKFSKLKKLMAGIRDDLKESADALLESPDSAYLPQAYSSDPDHSDPDHLELLGYKDENAYPFMVVWRDMYTRQYTENGEQTDTYMPLLLVGVKKEMHADLAGRFKLPFLDRDKAVISGRVWDYKQGPLVSFWNREEDVRKYWEFIQKLLRGRIATAKFQFIDDDYDTWRDYKDVKPGTAVSKPKLSDEEVKELMKQQHLDPNAKRILKDREDVQVEPKLAGYPTAAQYNFAKTIGDSVEDQADKLLENPTTSAKSDATGQHSSGRPASDR